MPITDTASASTQAQLSKWSTASDNFTRVLQDPKSFSADGKLTEAAITSLLGSVEAHGVSRQEVQDILAVTGHMAQTGHATSEIIAQIRERVTGDRGREGALSKLVADALELFRENRLPSAAWIDRPVPDAAKVNWFLQVISGVQHDVAVQKNIPVGRGFHYQQLWAGSADVEFKSDLPPMLLEGPLKHLAGQSTKAVVRFSHGTICPHLSKQPDVLGIGLKIALPTSGGEEDGRQRFVDVLATNAPMQLAHDTEQFVKFAEFTKEMELHGGLAAGEAAIKNILNKHFAPDQAARILAFLTKHVILHKVEHVASETYWSQDHQFGEFVGRVVIIPQKGAEPARGGLVPQEGFERKGMEESLAKHDVTMTIAIQFNRKGGILDGAAPLDTQPVPIGTIRFSQRAPDGRARQLEEEVIAKMGFDPMNGVGPEVGGFKAEDRGRIYQESRKNREAISDSDPRVQSLFEALLENRT